MKIVPPNHLIPLRKIAHQCYQVYLIIRQKRRRGHYRALACFKNYIQGNVLDAGCGDGRNLMFTRKFARRVIGVDANEKHIKHLRSRGFEAELQDLNKFPYPFQDEEYDTIICTHVLEHLLYPLRTLAEFHRILRQEGYLILAIPNPKSIYFNFYNPRWKDHVNKWSLSQMKKILADHGYHVMRVVTNPPFSANHLWAEFFNFLPVISIWSDFCFLCRRARK